MEMKYHWGDCRAVPERFMVMRRPPSVGSASIHANLCQGSFVALKGEGNHAYLDEAIGKQQRCW